jgi:hypothetical protein
MKHLQHEYETFKTYACNIAEGREREVQPEKPTLGLATLDLVMSQAKVERCDVTGVDSGHDLLVRNGGVGSTSAWRGTGHGAQGRWHDATRQSGRGGGWSTAWQQTSRGRGMGAPPRGSLGRADGAVSRIERSEELEIYVGYRSVDGV